MPDKQGKLTEEELFKARSHLETLFMGGQGKCPFCGSKSWGIVGHMVAPVLFGAGYHFGGSAAYPQIMAVCNVCGLTLFFNAVKLKIAPWKGHGKGNNE